MALSGSQVANYYQQQAATLSTLIDSHKQLAGQISNAGGEIQRELTTAKRELAAVYLPALTDEALERAARLTGFQGFQRRDPRAAMAHERHVLEQSVARLAADERYQRRDLLVGVGGTLLQEHEAVREALAPLEAECARFELLPDFTELVAIGYDTPAFSEKWWQASYWRHWSAGDRICRQLDMKDFGDDVLPAYRKYAEPRDVLKADAERVERLIDAVHEVVREHDRHAARLAQLEEIYLGQSQDFLGEHLEHADPKLLEEWAQQQPDLLRAVQVGVRRVAGVQAKRKFVGEIGGAGVPQIMKQLEERRSKAYQKAQKFSRPKYAYSSFPERMIQDGFDDRARAIAAQREKINRRVDTVVVYRDYGGFNPAQDEELWWYHMTGSPPPRYCPSLFHYHQHHPNATVLVDPWWDDHRAHHRHHDHDDDDVALRDDLSDHATAAAFAAGGHESTYSGSYVS
ncbi:MAG: hypothetical protein KIT31_08975 [Deltaproteobacteria bacterium]|nr:hypothetical protein [Deltaproteobacteria bacterium]